MIAGGLLNIFATKLFYQHAGALIPLHVQVSECLSAFSIYPLWSKEDQATTRKTIHHKGNEREIELVLLVRQQHFFRVFSNF